MSRRTRLRGPAHRGDREGQGKHTVARSSTGCGKRSSAVFISASSTWTRSGFAISAVRCGRTLRCGAHVSSPNVSTRRGARYWVREKASVARSAVRRLTFDRLGLRHLRSRADPAGHGATSGSFDPTRAPVARTRCTLPRMAGACASCRGIIIRRQRRSLWRRARTPAASGRCWHNARTAADGRRHERPTRAPFVARCHARMRAPPRLSSKA